jgi:hypothetical protein
MPANATQIGNHTLGIAENLRFRCVSDGQAGVFAKLRYRILAW